MAKLLIVAGPSNLSLMFALFSENRADPREVTFRVEVRNIAYAFIGSIRSLAWRDDRGENVAWGIIGSGSFHDSKGTLYDSGYFEAHFNPQTRKGEIEISGGDLP